MDLDDPVITARERVPSILQKQERRILSARGWTRARRAVSLTHTFCRCLCFQHLILNPSTPANADGLHLDDCQYQSLGFYKAKKQLIDRSEEVSGGIKADISPDRGSTEASFFSITSHKKNKTPKFHVTCLVDSRESESLFLPPLPSPLLPP